MMINNFRASCLSISLIYFKARNLLKWANIHYNQAIMSDDVDLCLHRKGKDQPSIRVKLQEIISKWIDLLRLQAT